jgi:hypothetical protein
VAWGSLEGSGRAVGTLFSGRRPERAIVTVVVVGPLYGLVLEVELADVVLVDCWPVVAADAGVVGAEPAGAEATSASPQAAVASIVNSMPTHWSDSTRRTDLEGAGVVRAGVGRGMDWIDHGVVSLRACTL